MREIEKVMYQEKPPAAADPDTLLFVQVDPEKCQGCGECDNHCPTGAVQARDPAGVRHVVSPAACINCGQCLVNCPHGAVYETVSYVDEITARLKDPATVAVSMPAPAVRYALGECFGYPTGAYVGGKMHAALKQLGFRFVWDNEYTADVTIMEEGTELLQRISKPDRHKPLPQFTSCCPGWVKFVESYYPDLLPYLSTCKSPIGMLGALAKTHGAQETKTPRDRMYTVSIMPCIAKKFEGLRPEMAASGCRDIDATITTRELAFMIKQAGIDFKSLPDMAPDPILGMSTGAATIFATSGGVMEAALRLAYEVLSKQKLPSPDIKVVRTHEGINTVDIKVPRFGTVKVAVASGLASAAKLCDEVRAGKSPYHFIEIMTCPGGCVNGGGQPMDPRIRQASLFKRTIASVKKRYNMRTTG